MAKPRSSKRDIDRVKQERAARKRERRQQPEGEAQDAVIDEAAGAAAGAASAAPMSEGDVLEALNLLHTRFDGGELAFDQFEVAKLALLDRLADR